ncbi:hypothetical protein Nepgr_016386 [Nepenthes gracilis]|uniref:Uncharacterized protein n=1 Tax=Nepenthes gracilis TaxID=150966 RepID=A0AAD3SPP5_NEPGR|nr:hypothetical protein Nepgr_016386 [Nepenthes gracilis]
MQRWRAVISATGRVKIHQNRIKDQCIWTLKVPVSTPWYWRKIMKLWSFMCTHTTYSIGDGSETFLWLDNWHPFDPLRDVNTDYTRLVSVLPWDVKVTDIIRDDQWSWPNPFDLEVSCLVENMPDYLSNVYRKDSV